MFLKLAVSPFSIRPRAIELEEFRARGVHCVWVFSLGRYGLRTISRRYLLQSNERPDDST